MSRKLLAFILVMALAVTLSAGVALAQIRIDVGVDIPRGFGNVSGGVIDTGTIDFLDKTILPFPEAGLYYQFDLSMIKLCVGVRCFTFIVESIFWPNAIAEVHLGNFVIEGQMGGGFFGIFGVVNSSTTGKVFIPDLSAWYKIGNVFRVGGGAIGLFFPETKLDILPFVYYLGAKFCIVF